MFKKAKLHLETSGITYREHMSFALKAGIMLLYAGVASLIHAFLPSLFAETSARVVGRLYKERIKNHPNPAYRKMFE